MGWQFWAACLVLAVAVVAAPLLPRPRTARGRRFRLLGWALAPTTTLAWVGFLALDPAGAAWLYYSAFVLVLGLTAALLFAGFICAAERKASRDEGRIEPSASATADPARDVGTGTHKPTEREPGR
jgi:hypothetical protein